MRLLILGASGFLGRHTERQAAAAGAQVVTASRAERPQSPGHRQLDLAADEPARIAAMIASVAPDAVLNCAGATTGGPVHEDSPGPARSSDVPWNQADITLARQDLDWRPRHDLAAAVADLWEGGP